MAQEQLKHHFLEHHRLSTGTKENNDAQHTHNLTRWRERVYCIAGIPHDSSLLCSLGTANAVPFVCNLPTYVAQYLEADLAAAATAITQPCSIASKPLIRHFTTNILTYLLLYQMTVLKTSTPGEIFPGWSLHSEPVFAWQLVVRENSSWRVLVVT